MEGCISGGYEMDNIGRVYGDKYGDGAFERVQHWKESKETYTKAIELLRVAQREYPDSVLKKETEDAKINLETIVEVLNKRLKHLSEKSKPERLEYLVPENAPKLNGENK